MLAAFFAELERNLASGRRKEASMLQTAMPSPNPAGLPAAVAVAAAFPQETAALRPVVRAVVACVLGERQDHPDVEDCTHETLRRALEGRSRLREGEPLRPWVLGIARHVAIDARRRRRRDRLADDPPGDDESESLVNRVADPGPTPDERAAGAERARRIATALDGLAPQQRQAMVLFHVEGEGYQRIAEILGVPLGTVATWLSRGRRTLADALGEAVEK
jgi:RNA polymerase sigma-70 factor (ECF subfamily)